MSLSISEVIVDIMRRDDEKTETYWLFDIFNLLKNYLHNPVQTYVHNNE